MIDPAAATLRHALRAAHREGVGRAYPKALRERVVAYARRATAAGRPRADVADAYASGLTRLEATAGRARRSRARWDKSTIEPSGNA